MSVLSIGAHRALPDVMAMERILTHASLASCLAELPIRSSNTQRRLWEKQKRLFQRSTALIRSLGKPAVTSNQAKRLDSLGFAYQDLVQLYSNSKDKEDFITTLKKRGGQ